MRISDWSSDVCSSDLLADLLRIEAYGETGDIMPAADFLVRHREVAHRPHRQLVVDFGQSVVIIPQGDAFQENAKRHPLALGDAARLGGKVVIRPLEIGRATCRESVWQSVEILGGTGTIK